MKKSILVLIALTNVVLGLAHAAPLSSAFTYQGRLTDNGQLANDTYDFQFRLFDAPTNGAQVPVVLGYPTVAVSNGLFTTGLDFGSNVFNGTTWWLEISLRPSGTFGDFTFLTPRQSLTPTPNALFAHNASLAATATTATSAGSAIAVSANGVNKAALQAGVVDSSKIDDGTITAADVNASAFNTTFWKTDGNTATLPGTHFLGTTDKQAMELRAANLRALRLEPTLSVSASGAPNVIGGSGSNSVGVAVFGATIGGGGAESFSGGAHPNRVNGNFGTVSGGRDNVSSELGATVGGGINNISGGVAATVSGGIDNSAGGTWATVGGGETNRSMGGYATVSGGYANTASGNYATIGGGQRNSAAGDWAVVNGGNLNASSHPHATVGGGDFNTSSGHSATVAGGGGNVSSGGWATVGGGNGNSSATNFTTVSGGYQNSSSGEYSSIGGGSVNLASGLASVVGGGWGNLVSSYFAMVPGGQSNTAGGRYSFAAGRRAQAMHDGAFVWADAFAAEALFPISFSSTISNEFSVRATGGVRFVTSIDTNGTPMAGVSLPAGSGSWSSLSDRNAKENLQPVDGRAVLEKVTALPLAMWNYKSQSTAVRHIGPMAQDFHAAFGVGENETTIATIDSDGVALAAIQGLNEIVKEKDARISALEKQNASLERRLAALEKLVLETAANGTGTSR